MRNVKVKERPRARGRIQMLPADKLAPTPDNRRKAITDASVRSLAHSITKNGLLQPLVVRDHSTQPDRWEIRAGERRWRAAKLAGLTAVPVVVRKLDNETALAVTIADNVQRQDLHPLEEAETLRLALDREYDLKAIAARLGKSVQYVARRASLTKLASARYCFAASRPGARGGNAAPELGRPCRRRASLVIMNFRPKHLACHGFTPRVPRAVRPRRTRSRGRCAWGGLDGRRNRRFDSPARNVVDLGHA